MSAPSIKLSPESWDAMSLLLNAAFADDVTERGEVEIIVNSLGDLNITDADAQPLASEDVLTWLGQNHDKIKAQYSGSKRHIELVILLTRMARRDDLEQLAQIVVDICRSDGVYHYNEKVLLDMMNSYWK